MSELEKLADYFKQNELEAGFARDQARNEMDQHQASLNAWKSARYQVEDILAKLKKGND